MNMRNWINQLLDLTIVLSFDRSGFKRHCPDQLKEIDLSGLHGIVTGASSGIGFACAKALIQQGMECRLIARNIEKLKSNFRPYLQSSNPEYQCLDMSDLSKVYSYAVDQSKEPPIDLIIHNAGDMPLSLTITKDGFEEMFASQVLGPFILTKTLADLGKLHPNCRIIFVSSGGMYLQKLDLSDLLFSKRPYNKYTGYANAKRAQVILSELFSKKYPQYLFSAMHPGWTDTPGVRYSLPTFTKLLNTRFRSVDEGADTILWLATIPEYPTGKFWFDRKEANTTILNLNKSSETEEELLWSYCEEQYSLATTVSSIKGLSQ